MISSLAMSGPLSATPIYTNEETSTALWGRVEVLVEMATTGVLGVGAVLLPVVRWVDADNRSRSISLPSVSLLDSTASSTVVRPIVLGPSKVLTVEVSVINVLSGSYTYNIVGFFSANDLIQAS